MLRPIASRAALAPLLALLLGACATAPPEQRITFSEEFVENGSRMFDQRTEVSTRGEGNEHLVGIRAASESTGYLYYASRQQIDRDRARVRRFGDIYRVELDTLEVVEITEERERAEAIEHFSSYRNFRYHEPTNEGLFSSWIGAGKLAYERTYSFDLVADHHDKRLSTILRWVYDRDPRRLILRFESDSSSARHNFPPEIFDLSNVGEPDYWRTLSAMRYRATSGHVTFFDSVVDLNEGRRIPLIDNAPSGYIETIAVSPSWQKMLVLYKKYRETKYLTVLDINPPPH